MSSRTINAPGIEINEIDRSAYGDVDESQVGTLAMVLGFADKGDDYDLKWINTKTKLEQVYGIPQTEAERYFYNGCMEVLNLGGILVAGKLPYANNSLDQLVFTQYQFDTLSVQLSSVKDIFETENPQEVYLWENYDRIRDLNLAASFLYSEVLNETWWGKNIYDISAAVLDLSRRIPNKNPGALETINDISSELFEIVNYCHNNNLSSNGSLCSLFIDSPGAFPYEMLSSSTVDFARGLIGYLKDTCTFRTENQPLADRLLNANFYSSVNNLQDVLSQKDTEVSPEISALREDILPMYPDMDSLLGAYLKTVPMSTIEDSYFQLSSLLQDTECSTYVESKIPLSVATILFEAPNTELKQFDDNITSMIELRNSKLPKTSLMPYSTFDDLTTGNKKAPSNGMYIVDITRQKYQKDAKGNQYIGLVPVVTTAANALYYMNYLVSGKNTYRNENTVSAIRNSMGS